jgi:hypothetical protein
MERGREIGRSSRREPLEKEEERARVTQVSAEDQLRCPVANANMPTASFWRSIK